MRTIRVFHLPYRAPYTRKIVSSYLQPVTAHEMFGDCSLYLRRSFLPAELDAFDVLHIHSLHDGTVQEFQNLLAQCAERGKRVVYTAHDLHSLRKNEEEHYEKLLLICSLADAVIALTRGSAEQLLQMVNNLDRKLSIIPHGFSVHPYHPGWGQSGSQGEVVNYAIHGKFRASRDLLGFAQTWHATLRGKNARLNILLPNPDASMLHNPQLYVEETLIFLYTNSCNMSVLLEKNLSDERVISFLASNDILVLPYRWGTHSGQLEMAFDLNMPVLAPRVGFFAGQWNQVQSYVPEPYWFDWPDHSRGNTPLPQILQEIQACEKRSPELAGKWRSYRVWEHREFLQAHYQIYAGASIVSTNLGSVAKIREGR